MRKLLLLAVAGALTARSLTFALDLDVARSEKLPVGRVAEEWVYASETSAIVYWQTENRARSYVEYGDTVECKERTPTSGVSAITKLPYWTQFHRITGLSPGKRYYYRMVCIGTDGKVVRGEAKTLETKRYSDAIRAPDDLAGPPYVLDRANATYLMTKDIRFPSGGFEVKAEGITLDMDGHKLDYNEEEMVGDAEWSERAYNGNDFGADGFGYATLENH